MTKTLIAATVALLFTVGVANAQTPKVEQLKPFGLAATHDGVNTDNYTLDVKPTAGGASVISQTKPVSALSGGDITFSNLTAPARGSYTAIICATNTDALSACSDPFDFNTTKGMPSKPGKPRIVQGLLSLLEKPIGALAKVITGKNPFEKDKNGFGQIRLIIQEG